MLFVVGRLLEDDSLVMLLPVNESAELDGSLLHWCIASWRQTLSMLELDSSYDSFIHSCRILPGLKFESSTSPHPDPTRPDLTCRSVSAFCSCIFQLLDKGLFVLFAPFLP